jgi:hypothetical protein
MCWFDASHSTQRRPRQRAGGLGLSYGDSAFNFRADTVAQRYKAAIADAPKTEFVEPFQSDLPCPGLPLKIFPFPSRPNHLRITFHPVPRRGTLAIVTNVGAGSGGRGSVVA